MSQPPPNQEALAIKGKLNALSAVIRLGHEAYEKPELIDWANHVVNNSVLALPYYRSAMIDLRGVAPQLIAVSGQSAVNVNSEYARDLLSLAKPFGTLSKVTQVSEDALKAVSASPDAVESFIGLSADSPLIYLVPLKPAGCTGDDAPSLLWVVEFDKAELQSLASPMLTLLREHYVESLFFALNRKRAPLLRRMINRRSWLRPSRILLLLLAAFLVATVTVRIRQTVSADFEIIPADAHAAYAPFEALIAECMFRSGDTVKKGDVVIRFDVNERAFLLDNARNEYNRISAQLDLVRQQSFNDPAKRGQVRLLELQKEKAEIDIKRNEWFLAHGEVKAESDGILEAGDTSRLIGRAVRPGEKLFELLDTRNLAAEIQLDERNSSVFNENSTVTLYLHTRPEIPIPAKIENVSGKPIQTANRTFCYMIRAGFDRAAEQDMICGMRGIARIAGERVTLGYYLFRHLVLYYRRL